MKCVAFMLSEELIQFNLGKIFKEDEVVSIKPF